MRSYKGLAVVVALLMFTGLSAFAQAVISTQSGLINHTEGAVLLNGRYFQPLQGQFKQMQEQDTLSTDRGRAELLLNPGVFLRVNRNTEVKLVSGDITDSSVDLVGGAVIVEAADVPKGSVVTLTHNGSRVTVNRRGLYRLDAQPPQLRVFDGKAVVQTGDRKVEVGRGRMLALDGPLVATKFNRKEGDALDAWSEARAFRLASASLVTARSLRSQRGYSRACGWGLAMGYGLYTYLPCGGLYFSPYGYYFTGPRNVNSLAYVGGGGGGGGSNASSPGPTIYPGASSSSSMGGASMSSGGRVDAPSTPSAPASRGGGGRSGP